MPLKSSLGWAFWCWWCPANSRNAKKRVSICRAKITTIVLRLFCMVIEKRGFHHNHFQSDFRHHCIRRICSTNRHIAQLLISWRMEVGFYAQLFHPVRRINCHPLLMVSEGCEGNVLRPLFFRTLVTFAVVFVHCNGSLWPSSKSSAQIIADFVQVIEHYF